jgi:putative endopeptidase
VIPAWSPAHRSCSCRSGSVLAHRSSLSTFNPVQECATTSNISDLAGLAIAWDGLALALARDPEAAKTVTDGRTPQQRFFYAFAAIWRDKQRDEFLLNQLRTGSHSPARYRVLGTLANFEPFARTFECPADAPMLRPRGSRIVIW